MWFRYQISENLSARGNIDEFPAPFYLMLNVKTIEYRPLIEKDYRDIISLWKRAGLPFKPDGRDSEAELTRLMEQEPDLIIGAFEENELVGVIVGSDDGRRGWLNRLAVDPAYRLTGLARSLVQKCEGNLRSRGRKIICAHIEAGNLGSQAFARELGYVIHDDIVYVSKRESDDV